MNAAILTSHVRLKRAYLAASADDGLRILVDRLWPRGVSKEKAALDDWLKDIAPSTELRKWFNHDPTRWSEFQKRYRAELARNPAPLQQLRDKAADHVVTLIYGARDTEHNEAVVLRQVLLGEN
ncbi:DUF488 domain-containing protein [Paracoccus caeni]|uniref:DUF488 domain-containing protein n=1 Tax=Paracoccus caeni TaxID=657651 RepID=A0A934VW23_9RHOB|nr:DUF488 domain-containing protein [Paracoccus caeni]MBK4217561.1 DUF488 domain-containing protein [Paracoccus caeni]